jgi:hypothetical protein
MSEFLKGFIKRNKPQFQKYEKYLKNNDWTTSDISDSLKDSYFSDLYSGDAKKATKAEIQKRVKEVIAAQKESTSYKSEEFKLQNDLVLNIIERLKYLVKKERDHHLADFKSFVKSALKIINFHTERVNNYVDSFDISKIENQDVRAEEMKLIKACYAGVNKVNEEVDSLNIKDDSSATQGISFLNETKAPLSMHWVLSEIYPEINRKLKELKVDPEAEPDNSLHILNPNPPKWNPEKHYWEQDKETLQYYFKEFSKLRDGILIDGWYMSGWMYYHMNVFVTPIPHSIYNEKSGRFENKDKIINPPLRDSDVMIFLNHERQLKGNHLFMFIAATRRMAKTTLEASKLCHAATIGKKELLCAGSNKKDLGQLSKNIKTDIQYKNPAFATFNVSNDWTDKVELGLKNKSNKTLLLSTINIINTDNGNNVEILAGYTPDEFLYDEAMKSKFIEALQGLKPAMKGTEGLVRCFGMLSGTGGDVALSADGYTVLNAPEENDILPMQWDILERGIPEDCITWEEDKQKSFGTFVPGQCCVDMPKIESNLADYLGLENCPNLSKIKIKVTDWRKANEIIKENRDKLIGNRIAHNKEVVYMPITPSEIFMSGKISPFPLPEAKAHKEFLLETGLWDRRRDIYRDSSGKIRVEISTKELVKFPHKGGIIDAPFLIFEDPPKEKPKYGTYTAGFDDYATDDSTTTSVSTFFIMKNKIIGDPFSEKVVASISFRPERHNSVYEKWLLLMELYGLETTCFGENFNYNIKDFLEKRHLADTYLAPSLDVSQTFNLPHNLKRKTGWEPKAMKKYLFERFVDYCNETYEYTDENDKIITVKGIQRIDDIGLLDEIIGWGENVNTDRITAVMGAWGYIFYLQSSYRWKIKEMQRENREESTNSYKKRERNFYAGGGRQKSFYRGRR